MINRDHVVSAIEKLRSFREEIYPRIRVDNTHITFWLVDAIDTRIGWLNRDLDDDTDDTLNGVDLVEEALGPVVDIINDSDCPYAREYTDRIKAIM